MKKLTKSNNKIIFGVCGGIGNYFNIDPTIVRLIMIIVGISGAGVLFYIIAALLMPSPDFTDDDISNLKSANPNYEEKKSKSENEKGYSDDEFNKFFKNK